MITGFLGAGKTTFLKNLIRHFSGQRLHLIINEFGREGVDGALLSEMGAVLDEICNGSIFCSCRLDKFEQVLERTLKEKPDVILVEASGLSNPMNVKNIMNQPDKFEEVEYMGSICLVDAKQFLKVYETAVVVKKQLSVSDLILINKADLAGHEQIEQIRDIIKRHHPDAVIQTTTFGQMKSGWLTEMGQKHCLSEQAIFQSADITLKKYLVCLKPPIEPEKLQKFVQMFLEDTYRVKGFVETTEGCYLVNCVGSTYGMEPFTGNVEHINELVVLSGNGLPAGKAIKQAVQWYPKLVQEVKK